MTQIGLVYTKLYNLSSVCPGCLFGSLQDLYHCLQPLSLNSLLPLTEYKADL